MFRSALFVVVIALAAAAQQDKAATPSSRDVTIKTRVTRGLMMPNVSTLRLKGARELMENRPDSPRVGSPFVSVITQCDRGARITLYEHQKNYREDSFHVPAGQPSIVPTRIPARLPSPAAGPVVTVKLESSDTGQRRSIGSYQARRIKTTITVEPGKGALTKKGKTKIDGWYLDLPGWHCDQPPGERRPPVVGGWHPPMTSGGRDQVVYQYEGNAPRGYPVEETSIEKSAGNVVVNKTELLELSEELLDDSLFEIPADYTPAPIPHPGAGSVVAPSSLHPE